MYLRSAQGASVVHRCVVRSPTFSRRSYGTLYYHASHLPQAILRQAARVHLYQLPFGGTDRTKSFQWSCKYAPCSACSCLFSCLPFFRDQLCFLRNAILLRI